MECPLPAFSVWALNKETAPEGAEEMLCVPRREDLATGKLAKQCLACVIAFTKHSARTAEEAAAKFRPQDTFKSDCKDMPKKFDDIVTKVVKP